MITHNLTHPDFDPPDCPQWAKEEIPSAMLPFRGRNGMPDIYRERRKVFADNVRGIDRYHANQFIVYRPETAEYLYKDYTPVHVNYSRGLLPSHEALAREVADNAGSAMEKALLLLVNGLAKFPHPAMPPNGPWVEADRNLDDESLLKSGCGWCNEQARVFVRLCQASGIPARIVQLFYSDLQTGHCIAEFYAEGRWCMADASWLCVFPGADGKLLSAADCHDRGEGQQYCGIAYHRRLNELLLQSKAELNFPDEKKAAAWRQKHSPMSPRDYADMMNCFAIINYPLPA